MFLGLDLGTSGLKALLSADAQTPLATVTIPLTAQRPSPGWSEQHPDAWWQATLDALDALHRSHPRELAATQAIGLAGQMHGAVCLDRAGHPLRPAILWNDTRAAAECAQLEADFPALRQIAGNIAMPGFTAPKLLWLRTHEPDLFAQIDKVVLPKAYLRLKLSGVYVDDVSDASGTLWLDVARRDWSDDAPRGHRPVARKHAVPGRRQRTDRHALAHARRPLVHDPAPDHRRRCR